MLPVNELSDVCFVVLLSVIVLSVIMLNVVVPSVPTASPPPIPLLSLLEIVSLLHLSLEINPFITKKKVFKKSRNESSTRCPHGPRGHPGWSWRRWPEEDLVRAGGLRGRVRRLHQVSIS